MDINAIGQWLRVQGVDDVTYRNAIEIFIIVLLTAIITYVVSKILVHIERQFEKTSNLWDDNLLYAAKRPVNILIWLFGLSWAVLVAQTDTPDTMLNVIHSIQKVGVIACLTLFVVRFISGAEHILISPERMKEPMDETTVSAIGKLLRATVIITAVLVVLQTMGYSISGVLAFGGIGGIAVGFAAKDLLANFFGGLMIYLDRPFKVGDWVRSPDKQIEGTVEKIGWRLTTVRTFDKRPLYVPNSAFASISVENPSRMSHRRIYETIGVRYDDADKLSDIIAQVKAMLQSHEDIDSTQTLIVNFNAYAASSLDFFVYTFTKTTNWIEFHEVKQDVLFKILDIIEQHGAEVAFPTSTIHLPDELHFPSESLSSKG